jgi:hypothetical protein
MNAYVRYSIATEEQLLLLEKNSEEMERML